MYNSADVSRRAETKEHCEYLNAKGNMCGVGRCLRKDSKVFTQNLRGGVISIFNQGITDDDFMEEYRGHDISFWYFKGRTVNAVVLPFIVPSGRYLSYFQ